MKLKVIFIVVFAAIFGAMFPSWNFFKTENELFDKRQKIKTEVLLDSLNYSRAQSENDVALKDISENYTETSDRIALARSSSRQERLTVEIRMLNKRLVELKKRENVALPYLNILSKNLDSMRTIFKTTRQNSPAFLTTKKLYPFHGIYGEVFDQVKALALSKITTPSTAKFASFTDDETLVSEGMKDRYAVVSWVDAQNSYGATVRQKFVGVLEHTKTGTWKVLGFSFI